VAFLTAALAAALSYLAGSVSAAILVCRLRGLPDPRTEGSGNPGATNVLRVGGKGAAAMTLAGDALKGVLPVVLAKLLGLDPSVVALVAVAAFVGHLYPVFFNFQGGKGVATALGALLATDLTAGLLALLIWLAVCLAFRRSSLAALVTFALVPVLLLMEAQHTAAAAFAMISIGLFITHRANIQRLLDGTEPKLGDRAGAREQDR
jgi:glycerol-3-phosphate acyltransferase PlsY